MSNPTGPGQPDEATEEVPAATSEPEETTEEVPAETSEPDEATEPPGDRRFTAPSGFDAGSTQIIDRPIDPATEVIAAQEPVAPQMIPPSSDAPPPPKPKRSWGWVAAIVLIIAGLAGIAVLATILLTRAATPAVSQEEMVRATIQDFDVAVQSGDLATLRSITCGHTRDNYVRYDEKAWAETHARVAAAKQYPVVASIDQVVINGDHAEANVTTFMAYAPKIRSTRSFDLEFRDEQWKVCQAPA